MLLIPVMKFNLFDKKNKGGFMVLTMVLLVCAAVLVITTGIFLRTIGQVSQSGDSESSLRAWGSVNACAEYALWQMASTTETSGWSYTGDETLSVGDDTCYIYQVEDTASSTKIIKASSTVSFFTKKIMVEVATNTPSVVINIWEEVADFD